MAKIKLDTENKNRYIRDVVDGKAVYIYTTPTGDRIRELSLTEQAYKQKFGGL